ncbi:MAG: hypothetical protein IBJ18_03425 [Phycisphaerales bacterium]|nr:hypothetical protein [Phycisphaerales bacterium]
MSNNTSASKLSRAIKNGPLASVFGLRKDETVALRERRLSEDPVLIYALAHFATHNDDKDRDTWLEVWINLAGEREAAAAEVAHTRDHNPPGTQDEFGFPDGSYNNIELTLKTNVMKKSDLAGAWLQVRIHTIGNDTWRFSTWATLVFSDGTRIEQPMSHPETLNESKTQFNHYF